MAYDDILVHRATPVIRSVGGLSPADMVDGDFGVSETLGTPFACWLVLPQGTEDSGRRGRAVREPTLMMAALDIDGHPVALSPKDSLEVVAGTINVLEGRAPTDAVRWEVVGFPQPFGPPGDETVGAQVTLRRVED